MCGSMADIQSATAEIRRGKKIELECGPMPNVMAALFNAAVLLTLSDSDQRITGLVYANEEISTLCLKKRPIFGLL